jgi:cystathionine gamma-synthase
MDPEARATAGIKDSLLRLSVGIELGADLVRDLTYALDRTAAAIPDFATGELAETSV